MKTAEPLSPFVASLVNARQEQLAGLFRVGMIEVGLRLTLRPGISVGGTHIDAGELRQGLVDPGLYEVWRLDNTADGKRAMLLKLPPRGSLVGPELYDEHFVSVSAGHVGEFFEGSAE